MAIASKIACLVSLSDDLKRFVAKKWLRSTAIDNKVHKVGMVQKYFTSHRLKCCTTSYTSVLSISQHNLAIPHSMAPEHGVAAGVAERVDVH